MNATDPTHPVRPDVGPRRDAIAIAVASLVLVAMTQGPVISIWTRPSQPWDQFAVPTAVIALYLTAHGFALSSMGGRAIWRELPRGRSMAIGALCGAVLLSTLWSVSPPITFTHAIGFVGTALSGIWLALRLRPRQQAVAVFAGMQMGLTASSFAVARHWALSRDITGAWTGVYYNRNSLAPVAGLAILSSVFVVREIVATTRRPWARWVLVGVCLLLDLQAGALLYKSGSATSFIALATAGAMVALLTLARRRRWHWKVLVGGLLTAAGVGAVLVVVLANPLSHRAQRDDGYSSRTDIWGFVTDGIRAKPWGGWGFVAAWWDPVFRAPLEVNGWFSAVTTAHNGYLEIVLGAGVLGAAALLAFGVAAIGGIVRDHLTSRIGPWQVSVATFALVANVQESFIVANHFVWLLLVAAVVGRATGGDDIVPQSAPGYPARP